MLARVISRIDVVDTPWASELDLENTFLRTGPGIMRMLGGINPHRSRLQQASNPLNLLTPVRPNVTADYGYDLRIWMGVRRHLEIGRELDPQHDRITGLCRIADQCGNLDPLREGRIILPDERLRLDNTRMRRFFRDRYAYNEEQTRREQ